MNNLIHNAIIVLPCYCLAANQALIVYKSKNIKSDSEFSRRIIHGPNILSLDPNEWAHKFSWHGPSEDSKTQHLADKKQFEILNCAPDQFYFNVDMVRTSDDALIRVKLMIFYQIEDIETMLKETKDPIADFIK